MVSGSTQNALDGGSSYSTAEHRVPELIPVFGSHVKSPCLQVT